MISFLVAALNEEKNIASAVATISAAATTCKVADYEIILIDDGSTDGTGAIMSSLAARDPHLNVLRNDRNMGLGVSIRRGIEAARHPKFMVVPGDNDMTQDFIERLLRYRDAADILLTIPLNRESRSLARNIISMLYQMIYMIAFDIYVSYINGPGIWPTARARAVGLDAQRFSIISELNVKLLRSGCTYTELPGYFNAVTKERSTVTLRTLMDVMRLFMNLIYRVHVAQRADFSARPQRVQIDFSPAAGPA